MNIEVANRLQKLRKEKGYSQEQLAEALGISRQAVSKWERAEASPDTDNLILLARLYGVSLDELLSTDDDNEELKANNQANEEEKKEEPKFTYEAHDDKKCDRVNIGSHGIDVEDSDGNKVHVGWDGIRIYDNESDEHVNLSTKCIKVINEKTPKGLRIARDLFGGLSAIGCTLAYILMGCFANLWHPGWIVFLAIPVISCIPDLIYKRKLSVLPYPVVVTIAYLLLGFLIGGWHPYWFLFITIPIFYIIADAIDKLIGRDKNNIKINGENVSDVNLADLKGQKFTVEADGKEIIVDATEE